MTTTKLAVVEEDRPLAQFGEMSVAAVVERKRKIGEVMQQIMREGDHYGKIPGCGDKPTLFKAGAEVLATTFGLAPTFVVLQSDLPNNHREYRITCTLTHIATGANVGEGVGVCSTMESKYRWRSGERICPKCKKPTIIKGRDDYGGGWLCYQKRGGCGEKWPDGNKEIESQKTGRIENPDIADTHNTVLKMAKKRAQVDCTLTAVGASDLLTQDLEDLPGGEPKSDPHVDYDDASDKSFWDPTLVAIDEARDEADLKAMLPALKKLKEPLRSAARKRYHDRMDQVAAERKR